MMRERIKNDDCKVRKMSKEWLRFWKGMFLTCLLVGMFWTFDMGIQAEEVISGYCGENVSYVLTDDGMLTISGTGDMYEYRASDGDVVYNYYEYERIPWYSYKDSIAIVNVKKGVTNITPYAFYQCENLQEIDIPNSVTNIGERAFRDCESLQEIELPNSVTSIGLGAFWDCNSLQKIIIPDSVTRISALTFYSCNSLQEVVIPNGVTSVGMESFEYCISLQKIAIPDSVTIIGEEAFRSCWNLQKIAIPNSVTSIGRAAFMECENLQKVVIPDSVTEIIASTFENCLNLQEVVIPDSVTTIGGDVFDKCDNVTIYCVENSTAHTYAIENDIPYMFIDESSSGINNVIKVKVTATDRETNKIEPVENAEVKLYTDIGVTTFPTDNNGIAEVSLKGLTNEQIRNATISASKVVSRGKAIDGLSRDKLFEHLPKDEKGDYYRYTKELHSETIDSYGNWCGVEIYDEKTGNIKSNIDLTLSEPRMLVNLTVCYLADDSQSQNREYEENIKEMLNTYAHMVAEATDGHILIDKVLLFSTDSRFDFYYRLWETPNIASMADIQIQTDFDDPGKWWQNVTIHNNGYTFGFFKAAPIKVDNEYMDCFKHLKDSDQYLNRLTYQRIISGPIDIHGDSMIDDVYGFSATMTHETGHYLMGFKDEYQRGDGVDWDACISEKKPYNGNYGLMDNEHIDIELSRDSVEYAYMNGDYENTDQKRHTEHSWTWKLSCEDALEDMLINGWDGASIDYDFSSGKYKGNYSKVEGTNDRTATYSYAGLEEADFLSLPSESVATASLDNGLTEEPLAMMSSSNESYTKEPVGDVSFTTLSDSMTISVEGGNYDLFTVSWRKSDEDSFETALHNGETTLPIAQGDLAEIHVSNGRKYNVYFIDRTENTNVGYIYMSADNAVTAYVSNETEDSYSFIADNTGYSNGEYVSMNQATRISATSGKEFDSGEIYSVASYMAEIDYTTLSWFKCVDGEWTALETDYSEEENMNIGARADLDGSGTYVLMAKPMKNKTALSAKNLKYKQSADFTSKVTLSFDDLNTNSKYYNVYYSDTELTDKDADNVVVRSFGTDSTELTINLIEPERTVYAAVEIVLDDGSRSELSKITLTSGTGDISVTRLCGSNRYETSYAIASALKEQLGVERFDTVILANGNNFPDALAGSYLASVKDAPILMARENHKDSLREFIKNNLRTSGMIYVLGGTSAVPESILSGLSDYNIKRLAGKDRYETNLLILEEAGVTNEDILVCTGSDFADSLSASATGKPILLLSNKKLTVQQKEFLKEHTGNRYYVIGGTSAVSESMKNEIARYGTVERVSGLTRYETSIAVAEKFFDNPEDVVLAYAKNFPDGLSGGVLANKMNAPLVLTAEGREDAAKVYVNANSIQSGKVLGGEEVLPGDAVRIIFSLPEDTEI